MLKKSYWTGLMSVIAFSLISGSYLYASKKGKKNHLVPAITFLKGKRAQEAYNHSLNKSPRGASDCQPFCPKVDIWQYRYMDTKGQVHTSKNPIATKKEFWKIPGEARIISTTLFGNQARYLEGLMDFIRSFEHVQQVNQIAEQPWGYNTFTVRVYVAKRNPNDLNQLGELKNATDESFIEKLLEMGCEIAYVDNKMPGVRRDATFWRFMVAAEPMEPGHKIRYLLRDVDWKLTAAEAYTVGVWISSGLKFHRMQLFPICMGPMIGGTWGGSHTGSDSPFSDLKTSIENYPYRFNYGDDEMYLRDIVWPRIKYDGSILTHMYERGWRHDIANPYENSCEEPTQYYCNKVATELDLNHSPICVDDIVPKVIRFPLFEMAEKNKSLDELIGIDPAYFMFPVGVTGRDLKDGEVYNEYAIRGLSSIPITIKTPLR